MRQRDSSLRINLFWSHMTRPNQGLSLSLSRSVVTVRREPWERGNMTVFLGSEKHVYCANFRLTVSHNGNQIIYNNYIEIKYTKLGQPFKPKYPHTNSPDKFPYIFLKNSWENLLKDQRTFSLVIILLIPVTFVHDVVLTWLAENRSWSFFGQRVNGTFFCACVFLGLQSRRYPLRLSNIPLQLLTDHGRELLHAPSLRRSATA